MAVGTRKSPLTVRIGIPARLLPRGIRGILVVLLLILVVPSMLFEARHYFTVFAQRRAQELQANLEIARSVATTFDLYVDSVLRQELAVGTALALAQPLSAGQMNQILMAAARENPSIRVYRWIDPSGKVIASSRADEPREDLSDSRYFRDIVAGREWAVGDLSLGRMSGLVTFAITRGIRNERGELQGVLGAMINPGHLGDVLRIERAAQGSIMVIDRVGRVVYRYPGEQLSWEARAIEDRSSFIDSALAGSEAATTYTRSADGQRTMAGFAPIGSIGWVAVASRPEVEVVAPIARELIRESAEYLLVVVVALVAARFVGRALTSPIRRLREQALALGRGDLDQRVEVDAPAELADLAVAFNQMTEAIEARTREREIVLDIVRDVSDRDDLDSALHHLASQLARAVDVPICRVALLTSDDRDLVVRASYAAYRSGPAPGLGRTFPVDDVPPARQVIEGKQPVEIDSPESELLSETERQRWRAVGLQAALGVPLLAREKVIGLLSMGDVKPRTFAPAERRLILAVAQQAAIVIERARLHEQVALERERLETIIRNTSDGIILVDEELRVLTMNPAMEALTGWIATEAGGRLCRDLLRSRDRGGASLCEGDCPMARAIASGRTIPYVEVVITRRDGSPLNLAISFAFARLPSTRAGFGVMIARDITALKEAEQLKDEFVSLLSHDLRQPVSVIHGYGSILQRHLARDGGSSDAERYARTIVESAVVVNAMVADLTDSARLESGRLVLQRRPTALPDLVAEVLRTRVSPTDRLRVRVDARVGFPIVLADTDRLGRVIANLLSNALKYSPDDAEILVRVASSDGEAILSVADRGVGVPADEIPHLFDRFYRARTGRQYEGAGLGLYIARGLVEAHGGRIWVDSQPGNGSTFSIALPLVAS